MSSCTAVAVVALAANGVAAAQAPKTGSAAVGPDQAPVAVDPANDPTFTAALPPLDSIQAPAATTAAPVPAGDATSTTAPSAATPPSVTTATTVPLPADPILTQPLPPLAGFDPTPDTSKAKVPSHEEARIRYTVKVEGLDKIGLSGAFKASSALGKGKKAANSAQVAARAAADVDLAERLMKAQGYYDGIASSSLLPIKDDAGGIAVTISATPGMRYDFASITITGAAAEPTTIARDALPLKVGQPIVAADVLGGEANVGLVLPEKGYPFAKTGDRDILLDPEKFTGDYTLPITSGPRSTFGGLQTKGAKVFGLKHLNVFPRFDRGDPYDSRKADDLRQALVGTSLFSSVAVEPVDTGTTDAAGNEVVDLMVTQNKGPWHALSGSAGYGTGEGAKVEADYTWRNLFPPEGALSLGIIGGTLEQGANATFKRSNAGQRDRTLSILAGFDRTNFSAYEAKTLNLVGTLSRQSTPIWQKRWTWSVGAGVIGTNEQGAALNATGDRPRRTYLIGEIPLQVGYDTSDDLLNPTRGIRVTLRGGPEASIHKGVTPYGRAIGQIAGYQPIGKSIVLAGRVLVGTIVGGSLDEIAPSRRLYSGGGGSVRGYGFQELGPKDAQNNPIGGRDQTEFAAEIRYRFGNFGIVPFLDGGRVGESSTPGISNMHYGAGIGARYYTNFGPLRLDVATPLNPQPGDSRITLYISIGQAF